MHNHYYPAFLDLRGRPCVVIGGGEVGERKAQHLLDAGARVTIIAPQVTPAVAAWARAGTVAWEAREYRPGDLRGAWLVIAATDNRQVNTQVAAEAEAERALLNVVDVPDLCTFIAPGVVRRDPVVFAISTAGASPALARKLKDLGEAGCAGGCMVRWAAAAEVLARARAQARARRLPLTPQQWQECLDDALLALVEAQRDEEAYHRLMRMLEERAASAPGGRGPIVEEAG